MNTLPPVNYLAVLVATVVWFALGALWYSPLLFGKAWGKLLNIDWSNQDKPSPTIYILPFFLHLIATWSLAVFFGFLLGHTNQPPALTGLELGLAVSFGFAATIIGINYNFLKKPLQLWAIDVGYYVTGLSLAGVVLGLFA